MIAEEYSAYLLALAVIFGPYLLAKRKGEMRSRAVKDVGINVEMKHGTL